MKNAKNKKPKASKAPQPEARVKPTVAPRKTRKPPRQLRVKRGQPALMPRGGEPVDEEQLYDALVEGYGRIGRAADILGCHRATVARNIDRYPRLNEAIAEGERLYTEKLEEFTEDCVLDEDPRRDTLRMFMLKKRKPSVYSDKQDDNSQVLIDAMAFVMDKSKNPAEYKQS